MIFGLIAAVAAYILFKRHVAERGKRFVRAYEFLRQTNDGADVEHANGTALKLFTGRSHPDYDKAMILNAMRFAEMNTGGKQLPVIARAHGMGFLG